MATSSNPPTVSPQKYGDVDYSAFTSSIRITFTSDEIPGRTSAIAIKVNGKKIENVGIDSGSNIFVLSDHLVHNFKEANTKELEKGSIEYANGYGHKGYWFQIIVTFTGDDGSTMTSETKALVVTEQNIHHQIWEANHAW
jgi:hypothetical protein